jgi:hypothetical protein
VLRSENIRPYAEGDLDMIDLRDIDRKVAGDDYRESLKKNIRMSETITVEKDGEILAITGLVLICPGMAEIWSITSKAVDRMKVMFAKASIVVVGFWMEKYKLRRLQANVYHEHKQSIKWLEWLGFKYEGTMGNFGQLCEDFYLYARTT